MTTNQLNSNWRGCPSIGRIAIDTPLLYDDIISVNSIHGKFVITIIDEIDPYEWQEACAKDPKNWLNILINDDRGKLYYLRDCYPLEVLKGFDRLVLIQCETKFTLVGKASDYTDLAIHSM